MTVTAFNNMSHYWKSMKYTAAQTRTAGDIFAKGNTVLIAVEDCANLAEGVGCHQSDRILVPCLTATTGDYAIGTKVYYDNGNNRVTQTSNTGDLICGVVTTAPSVGDTSVEIYFDGTMNIVS